MRTTRLTAKRSKPRLRLQVHDAVRVRRATTSDVPFLVEAICEAEKAGTDRLSYCSIFGLDEAAFRSLLASMLQEDLEGQELCISGFLIAERSGAAIGACCGWVEGATDFGSALLKANLLLHAIDPRSMRAAQVHFRKLEEIAIGRTAGAIQIESVYVRAAERGRGIAGLLIERHLAELRSASPAHKAQIILTATNPAAGGAYARMGFVQAAERWSSDSSLLSLVPALGKLLMERTFT